MTLLFSSGCQRTKGWKLPCFSGLCLYRSLGDTADCPSQPRHKQLERWGRIAQSKTVRVLGWVGLAQKPMSEPYFLREGAPKAPESVPKPHSRAGCCQGASNALPAFKITILKKKKKKDFSAFCGLMAKECSSNTSFKNPPDILF